MILILIAFFAINILLCFLMIEYDSVELDETSPFFNDEIDSEGISKIKIKKKWKTFKTITKNESYQLCSACLNIETGSYLLRNSNDEQVLIHEIIEAENAKNPTER